MKLITEYLEAERRSHLKTHKFFNLNDRLENVVVLRLKKEDKEYLRDLEFNGLHLITIRLPNEEDNGYEIEYKRDGLLECIDELEDSYEYIILIERNYALTDRTQRFIHYALNVAFEESEGLYLKNSLRSVEKLEFNSSKNKALLIRSESTYKSIRKILELEGIYLEKSFNELRVSEEKEECEYLEFNLKKPFSSSLKTNGFDFIIPKGTKLGIPKAEQSIQKINNLINDGFLEVKYKNISLIKMNNQPFSQDDEIIVVKDICETSISSAIKLLIGRAANKKYNDYFVENQEILDLIEDCNRVKEGNL